MIVRNDTENLYITYLTQGDWHLKKLHLFAGEAALLPKNKGGAIPGQFPYKVYFDALQTAYTFVIPLNEVPDELSVAAHAEVVRVLGGVEVQSETGWAEGSRVGNNWSMSFNYTKQVCTPVEEVPVEEDVCYAEETAWAAGSRYTEQGSWATYTPYVANSPIDIYAGQHYPVGEVIFSEAMNGKVTITISLTNGAIFQDVAETVKIQGYEKAPEGNPAPGQFTTYKGTGTSVTVDAFNFYGIHLDVKRVIECSEE